MRKARKLPSPARTVKPIQRVGSHSVGLRAEDEILNFPARLLLDLPVSTHLTLRVAGRNQEIIWTTAEPDETRLDGELTIFFRHELEALLLAAESERAWTGDLLSWIAMKALNPDHTLDPEITLAGARPSADQRWTVGQLLRWYNCELVDLGIGNPPFRKDGGLHAAA